MSWILDVNVLQECVNKVLGGKTAEEKFRLLTDELALVYPGQIETEWQWYLTSAAGFVQPTSVLHVSLTEYLVLTGSAVPTTGFDGPYRTNDLHDYVVDGEIDLYRPGEFEVTRYTPGKRLFTPKGWVFASSIEHHCWNMEYARGNVLGMLPFPLIGTFFSSLDFVNTAKMFGHAGAVMFKQWRNRTFGIPVHRTG